MSKNIFWDRMRDEAPALRVEFGVRDAKETPRTVAVEHRLYPAADASRESWLGSQAEWPGARELAAFYTSYDGLGFCCTLDVRYDAVLPLIEFVPSAELTGLTARYQPGGDREWAIDGNKSRSLYRHADHGSWIIFAEVQGGPASLALFLDGEHAGHVFLVAPQPRFNILRPIAKGFDALLQRMGKDPAAFLRLVGALVCLRGEERWMGPEGLPNQFGFVPLDYLSQPDA
jgi:hypothetical protein